MTEPPAIPQKETKPTILLVWATSATLLALVSAGAAIFFFLQARPPSIAHSPGAPASPFLDLQESAIPGSYKWISKSGSESIVTLNADHTFSKGDTTNPQHRWEIARDALVIFWLRSQNRLTRIERPGVYIEVQDGVEIGRLEKQQ